MIVEGHLHYHWYSYNCYLIPYPQYQTASHNLTMDDWAAESSLTHQEGFTSADQHSFPFRPLHYHVFAWLRLGTSYTIHVNEAWNCLNHLHQIDSLFFRMLNTSIIFGMSFQVLSSYLITPAVVYSYSSPEYRRPKMYYITTGLGLAAAILISLYSGHIRNIVVDIFTDFGKVSMCYGRLKSLMKWCCTNCFWNLAENSKLYVGNGRIIRDVHWRAPYTYTACRCLGLSAIMGSQLKLLVSCAMNLVPCTFG